VQKRPGRVKEGIRVGCVTLDLLLHLELSVSIRSNMKIDPDSHVCNFHVDQNQFFALQHPVFHAYNLTENALLKRFLSLASELDYIASKPAEKHSRTCQH
jgi:hypothetical protein